MAGRFILILILIAGLAQGKALAQTSPDSTGVDSLLVEVPNVFTPNGDNVNDFLVLKTNGKTLYELSIFNKSGTIVYRKESYAFAWDGKTPSGANVYPGVYYYALSTGGKYVKTGFFHLIR